MSLKGVGGKLEIVLEAVGVGGKGSELGRVGRRETFSFVVDSTNEMSQPEGEACVWNDRGIPSSCLCIYETNI